MNILDELDADIENENVDEKRLGRLNRYRNDFVLCPTNFKFERELPDLTWRTFKHCEQDHELPDEQGVYMISVCIDSPKIPTNSYVLYVGKAGDLGTNNTIKKRYRNYVNFSGYKNRPRIKRMLELWSGHLNYSYARVPANISTGDIEETLTTIFVPPYNTADFSAELKDLLKGLNIL
jgi:hypothetical protein